MKRRLDDREGGPSGPPSICCFRICLFKRSRGLSDDGHHYFQEIIVNSDNLIHVFLRSKAVPDYVAVFVCRRTANLGMALTKARMAMPGIEAAV